MINANISFSFSLSLFVEVSNSLPWNSNHNLSAFFNLFKSKIFRIFSFGCEIFLIDSIFFLVAPLFLIYSTLTLPVHSLFPILSFSYSFWVFLILSDSLWFFLVFSILPIITINFDFSINFLCFISLAPLFQFLATINVTQCYSIPFFNSNINSLNPVNIIWRFWISFNIVFGSEKMNNKRFSKEKI
jgi:hypothetical protein